MCFGDSTTLNKVAGSVTMFGVLLLWCHELHLTIQNVKPSIRKCVWLSVQCVCLRVHRSASYLCLDGIEYLLVW